MKILINCIRGFYSVSIVISLLSFIGIFVKGPEWIVVFLMSLFMCMNLRKEYKGMEAEIEDHLGMVISAVYGYSSALLEGGSFSMEYEYKDRHYYINGECDIKVNKAIGGRYMGYEEMVYEEVRRVRVTDIECRNQFDEVCDCGFTVKDINEWL